MWLSLFNASVSNWLQVYILEKDFPSLLVEHWRTLAFLRHQTTVRFKNFWSGSFFQRRREDKLRSYYISCTSGVAVDLPGSLTKSVYFLMVKMIASYITIAWLFTTTAIIGNGLVTYLIVIKKTPSDIHKLVCFVTRCSWFLLCSLFLSRRIFLWESSLVWDRPSRNRVVAVCIYLHREPLHHGSGPI